MAVATAVTVHSRRDGYDRSRITSPPAPGGCAATANFERPFTVRNQFGSARNFGNTRFGRFAIFDFSMSKNFVRQHVRFEKFVFRQFGEVLEDLQPIGRQNQIRHQFFFPDKDFLRCVRPQIMKI